MGKPTQTKDMKKSPLSCSRHHATVYTAWKPGLRKRHL